VKSPRIYLRDTGILHALLDIETWDDLLGHPVFGHSWESMVIEGVLAQMPGWRGAFYRTATGAEIDLVLEKGRRRIAIECKASGAPQPTKGFWNALDDVGAREAWIVAPIEGSYPLARGAWSPPSSAASPTCDRQPGDRYVGTAWAGSDTWTNNSCSPSRTGNSSSPEAVRRRILPHLLPDQAVLSPGCRIPPSENGSGGCISTLW
jgi:hypothetical protein